MLRELLLHALDQAWPWGKERRFHWKPGDLFLVALFACFASQFVMGAVVNLLFWDSEYWTAHQWPKGLALILVGLAFLVYGAIPLLPTRRPGDSGVLTNEVKPVLAAPPRPWVVILVSLGWGVFFVLGGLKIMLEW